MFVLVVHSIHAHAASVVHDDSAATATSVHMIAAPVLEPGEFLQHAGAIAVTLEFAALVSWRSPWLRRGSWPWSSLRSLDIT
jgi:hypothetical protein